MKNDLKRNMQHMKGSGEVISPEALVSKGQSLSTEEEKVFGFNEQGPHTLADFVKESMEYTIKVDGLPPGVNPQEVAEKFSRLSNINLTPLPIPYGHYFYGWFSKQGRKICTTDGKHLFTLFGQEFPVFRLRIEQEGLALLQLQQT